MQTKLRTRRLVSLASLLGLVPTAWATGGHGHRVEGTWINNVKIVMCQSPQTVLAAFQSMTTYTSEGTLVEGGAPATPPPAVSRSPGFGTWERTGRREIQAYIRSHSFDNLGRLIRITEVITRPSLLHGDNPNTNEVEPYYLAGYGTNRITNIDPGTGQVVSVTEGCNYAESRPMQLP